MSLQECKNQIAISKGYPDWEHMENWIIDQNDVQNAVILVISAMEEVSVLFENQAAL